MVVYKKKVPTDPGNGEQVPKKVGRKRLTPLNTSVPGKISTGVGTEENKQVPLDQSDYNPELDITDGTIDSHPLRNNHYLVVKYRDGSNRLAKIIDHSKSGSSSDGFSRVSYYIHYCDFNRRMDEWIDLSRIVSLPSEANILGKVRETSDKGGNKERERIDSMEENNLEPNEYTSTSPRKRRASLTDQIGGSFDATVAVVSTVADMDHDEHEGMDHASLLEHEEVTKIKNIKYVKMGKYLMECWYFSPFPKEYFPNGFTECLYFCEYSMRFFRSEDELIRYQNKPGLQLHPPGNEIYRDTEVSMFEIDGAVEKIYCQNLCYFAKLFLDHKTLYWDVDTFLFYVLCVRDDRGFHPVGYFSKEKYSELGYNLACILTFPYVQRKGYGRFLMEFSYELSKKEEKAGSPEKPLSDLGFVGYQSYWAHTILKFLRDFSGQSVSVMDVTRWTSILPEDIYNTLRFLNLIKNRCTSDRQNGKSESVLIKSESTCATEANNMQSCAMANNELMKYDILIYAPLDLINSLLIKYPEGRLPVQPERLHWAPLYVVDPKKDKWSLRSLATDAISRDKSEINSASGDLTVNS